MQQRLALAQALMRGPRILLLDEPFGALDPGIRADIHALTRRLWHQGDLTVVMVTHDLREAFSLATRVVAFERRPDRERCGATVTRDLDVWPKRIAGQPVPPPSAKAVAWAWTPTPKPRSRPTSAATTS